jgi:hypothetical protein
MTPTVRDVLQGCAIALSRPTPPEAGPDYAASRMGMVSMLTMLAAQEAEQCAGAAIQENAAIRAVLGAASPRYDAGLAGRLASAAGEQDADLSVPALDAANARLRGLLIELHQAVEAAGDAATDTQILALYVRMGELRRLTLG